MTLKNYLFERLNLNPLLTLLIIFLIYDSHINRYVFYGTSAALTIILIMLLFRAQRILVYLFICSWLFIALYQSIFITSEQSQDLGSDRDDAVEIAASSLSNGNNPWLSVSGLDNPITTGPTSILIAIPSVAITGKVNSLTFLFWMLFFCVLIISEYHYNNNSFILLFLLFLAPMLCFQHTIFYSLDELYYGLIFLPILLWLLNRELYFLSGIIFPLMIFSRLSYIFVCAGMFFWWVTKSGWDFKKIFKMLLGFILGSICLLIPFVIVSGNSIYEKNFISNSFLQNFEGNNKIITFIQGIGGFFNFQLGQIIISIFVLIIIWLFSLIISKYTKDNPFGIVGFASLMAFSIIFTPVISADYILSMIIPLFYLIAFTKEGW